MIPKNKPGSENSIKNKFAKQIEFLLPGKKIIITGGSMGIGWAIAQACAKEGAIVTLVSRHEKDLKKTGLPYYVLDVSHHEEVAKMARHFQKSGVDGVVNAAGIYGPIGKTEEVDLEKFEETLKINFLGTLYICHYFTPLLKKSSRGKIVNLAGGGASSPFPNYSAYATSKAAVVRLTENLSLESAKENLDINAISPGFVITRLHQQTIAAGEKAGESFLKKTQQEIAKGGISEKQAADLAVFLLSPDSDGISGKLISAPWDPWQKKSFQKKLKSDPDFCTLRRIDNNFFGKL